MAILCATLSSAWAGPPYISDDPEPTDYHHYEIYFFDQGTRIRDDSAGAGGVDFNTGAGPNLQLTAVLPIGWNSPQGGRITSGRSNIELAAKYRFLHHEDVGWDAAVFPRVFLPASARPFGNTHVSFLFPLWFGRSWGEWGTFGGGGCARNRGDGAQDYCLGGWALTRQITAHLQFGGELTHQTADTKGGKASSGFGLGMIYDLGDHQHLLAYLASGVQNTAARGRYTWYTSYLFTF